MSLAKTTIEWHYTPEDYFEAPFTLPEQSWEMVIDAGTIRVTLAQPENPVSQERRSNLQETVRRVFSARALQVHKISKLGGIRIIQEDSDGRQSTMLEFCAQGIGRSKSAADFILKNREGQVLRDTRAERIAADESFIREVLARGPSHPLISRLMDSYSAAIEDCDNEFLHLYEIREALCKHFGGKKAALMRLGIPDKDWTEFGGLTNNPEIRQGRHRGRQHVEATPLRPATCEELRFARQFAKCLIEKFARAIE